MEQASPGRLLAALGGAALVIYGMVGFFHDSSFAAPASLREAIGLLAVNGWANAFHMLTGALGLLLAGFAPRRYVLVLIALYALVAISGTSL
jgi:Domain of unknown function (DUF4383)